MTLCAIAAVSKNGVIGKDGELPWHYPEDLKHFKNKTINHPLIMGRKTYESFSDPLPNRHHIVLTRDESLKSNNEDVIFVNSIDEAIEEADSKEKDKSYVIGGGLIYELFIDYLDEMILTEINEEYEGDTYYPEFNSNEWDSRIIEDYPDFNIVKYNRTN